MSQNSNNSNDVNSEKNSEKEKTNDNVTPQEKTPDHKSSDYIDMVLSRKGAKVVDSETLVKETQKRLWASLKQGFEYPLRTDDSDRFGVIINAIGRRNFM